MSFQKLLAYQNGLDLAMKVFDVSKSFPKEETYSPTDRIRLSSSSVCANIAESYRKKRYKKHFISKLTDADAENSQTEIWLQFASTCGYLTSKRYEVLLRQSDEVGKLI